MADDNDETESLAPGQFSSPEASEEVQVEKKETTEEIENRRKAELDAVIAVHKEAVDRAHAAHPTRPIPFAQMDQFEQLRAVERQKVIAVANKKYFDAVNAVCARHRSEEAA